MNTYRTLTQATLISAVLAAAFMIQAPAAQAGDAKSAAPVTQLPRVVITGQVLRAEAAAAKQIVELPRVVVTGRRVVDGSDAQLVQNGAAKSASVKL